MAVKVMIGKFEAEYVLYNTKAPAAYDGFGTISLDTHSGGRTVAIQVRNEEWQTMRYRSGLHQAEKLDDPGMDVWLADMLLNRMVNLDTHQS